MCFDLASSKGARGPCYIDFSIDSFSIFRFPRGHFRAGGGGGGGVVEVHTQRLPTRSNGLAEGAD